MATPNFSIKNASSYYVILDTYECENEDGVMEEYTRDNWDFQDLFDDIAYRGEDNNDFPYRSEKWNREMDSNEICKSDADWDTYGKSKNAWTTETNIESVICYNLGYYNGINLDYDIKLQTCQGDNFYLSQYDNIDSMIEDYLNCLEDIVKWRGDDHKWNIGTFKMQKKNIRKWIEDRLEKEIEKCENFCKANCEMELCVSVRFSNGETWYSKVG